MLVSKSCTHVCMSVCHVTLCSVSPRLYSETIEGNPYRPTYIFPDNYDIQMKSKGIRRQFSLFSFTNLYSEPFQKVELCCQTKHCGKYNPHTLTCPKYFYFSLRLYSHLFCNRVLQISCRFPYQTQLLQIRRLLTDDILTCQSWKKHRHAW